MSRSKIPIQPGYSNILGEKVGAIDRQLAQIYGTRDREAVVIFKITYSKQS